MAAKKLQHAIESQQFDRPLLERLFKLATRLEKKPDNSMKGKIMASLFYEPSTRTRFSFEAAMLRLGGSVITTENAKEFSSAAKGESIEDSTRVIGGYVDVMVIRHPEIGTAAKAAAVSPVPVINAGDGAGQHPTQALLDVYTIARENKKIDGVKIAMVGDLKHGRTVRSLCYMLAKFKKVQIYFVSPKALKMGNDIKAHLKKYKVPFSEHTKLEDVISKVDVVYQTRIQRERFASKKEYEKNKGVLIIDKKLAKKMKKGAFIMHPLPRVDEITTDVDHMPQARYFEQAYYGMLMRMALLKTLAGR